MVVQSFRWSFKLAHAYLENAWIAFDCVNWNPFIELIIHKITKNYRKRLVDETQNKTLHIIWAEESPQFYFAATVQQDEFKRYLKKSMIKKGF